MSCSFCSSGIGYSRTNPQPPTYQSPIIDGTTEVILDLRRQCKGCDEIMARKAKGRYHWQNIPSGADFQREFDRKYPSLAGSGSYFEPTEFPYSHVAPPPTRPTSSFMTYSNLQQSRPSPMQSFQQSFQRPVAQAPPPQHSHSHSHHHSRRYDDDDPRIRRALQHIDHASRILENY